MKKNRIVVITDCNDIAFNEIRATLVRELEKIGADNIEIEPFVLAKEFSLINGAFLTRLMAEIYIPERTTFLVILNPLKTSRSDRARIIGVTKNGFKFVGENTGTLGWLLKDFGVKEIYETSIEGLDGKNFISFGGKYIHAPIAARVASTDNISQYGKSFDESRISYPEIPEFTVLHIDNFGVPKIYATLDHLTEGANVNLFVNGKFVQKAIYTSSMKNLPDGDWTIYKGSSLNNFMEVGRVRRTDTAEELGLSVGDVVTYKVTD